MYDSLTTKELTALQNVLLGAVDEAYCVGTAEDGGDAWLERYYPIHQEFGELFIEAGEELLVRLELRSAIGRRTRVPAYQRSRG
jgi:hypothetical protein